MQPLFVLLLLFLSAEPLFFGATPAFVCPQPHLGVCLDVFFEQLEVSVGQDVLGYGGWMVFHGDDVEVVVATLGSAHATVHHEGIDLAGDVLGSDEDGGIVVEERHEMVDAVPLGLLVADEADNIVLVFFAQLENAAESLFHLNVHATILTAQVEEELVHHFIVDVVIDLS